MPSTGEYYRYNHGTGEHILISDEELTKDAVKTKYSFHCFLCYFVDFICLVIVLGFFVFTFWICYYLFNNYSGGGG